MKLFGSSPSGVESQASVCRPTLKLFGSSSSCMFFKRRRNCWLKSHLSIIWPSQPLMTHVLKVSHQTITETKMLPIVCTFQKKNRNYFLIELLPTYFITQWYLAFFVSIVISMVVIIYNVTSYESFWDFVMQPCQKESRTLFTLWIRSKNDKLLALLFYKTTRISANNWRILESRTDFKS